MSAGGSVDRLLIRLMSLSISSTLCHSCSRLPSKQLHTQGRFGASRRSTSLSHSLAIGSHSPFLFRSYSTISSIPSILSTTLPRIKQPTNNRHQPIINWRSLGTDLAHQRDATTSIAMIHCAKRNDPDQCLQHYLRLLRSQGRLPSHEALHQLARVLYNNRHLSGFSILHDTLLAYHLLHPPSARQSRNLTYMYTMLINLIIRQPNNRRSSTNKKQPTTPPSTQQQIQTSSSSSSLVSLSSIEVPPPSLPPPETPSAATTTTFMESKTATIIQLCQEMRYLGLTGTPAFYNSLLKFCVMKKDADLAWHFFNELAMACTPTRYTFSILLDLMRQQQDVKGTLLVLETMDQHGVLPDRAMASTIMLTLCDQHQYTDAADLVDQLAHQCPQLMGPRYKSVLMETLHRHYRARALVMARRHRRLAKRRNKRRQARLEIIQQQ